VNDDTDNDRLAIRIVTGEPAADEIAAVIIALLTRRAAESPHQPDPVKALWSPPAWPAAPSWRH
jgi:hypothetical protein